MGRTSGSRPVQPQPLHGPDARVLRGAGLRQTDEPRLHWRKRDRGRTGCSGSLRSGRPRCTVGGDFQLVGDRIRAYGGRRCWYAWRAAPAATAAGEPATCRIAADQGAVDSGLCTPAIPSRSPALAEGGSLAYFTYRRVDPDQSGGAHAELGAIGHGPAGVNLAMRLCDQIRSWNKDRTGVPTIVAYQADVPNERLASRYSIAKRWACLAFTG